MDSNAILIALNVVLVGVTIVYVVLTNRISRANERAVAVMKEQAEAFYRPYVTVTHEITHQSLIHLIIKNTGKTNAENLKLSIDKDFYQAGPLNKKFNIPNLPAFKNVIESFPPEAEILLSLVPGVALSTATPDHPETPTVFKITASYSFSGKSVTETTTVDLRQYQSTFLRSEPVEHVVSKLGDTLKEIKEVLSKRRR